VSRRQVRPIVQRWGDLHLPVSGRRLHAVVYGRLEVHQGLTPQNDQT
jgi:hypothetical protein